MNKADIIIKGGRFYCGRNLDNDIDFVAVKGNRILATGKEDVLSSYIDENTKVIELTKENLVIPGIHDNHIHMVQAGMLCKYIDLFDARSAGACGKLLADYAWEHPEDEWIIGCGFVRRTWEDGSLPTKDVLDYYLPDKPVMAFDDELHCAWVNSKALEICNITKDTKDPEGGRVSRDENGNPSGILVDKAIALADKAFKFDMKTAKEIINYYVDYAVSHGITSVSDMTPYLGMDLSYQDVHLDMVEKGEARIRVNAARDLFEDIDTYFEHVKEADKRGKGFYSVSYMKQFADGTPAHYNGWLLEDYTDKPGVKGEPAFDVEKMRKCVKLATKNNISVRIHSCGDASCRCAMDAYEEALKEFPESTSRHMIEHLELVDPEDIPRFGKLGVIASIQPEHCCTWPVDSLEDDYPEKLGKRYWYSWPFRSIKEAGGLLAAGSDCPVVIGNPFVGMYSGIARKYSDLKMPRNMNPEETLTMEDMIEMYTIGASYAEKREDELGTIEPGKLADITVTDQDLFILAEKDEIVLRDVTADLTIVDGKIVYNNLE